MNKTLESKFADAIWSAASLFNRGKISGSAGNISFLHDGKIYISGSGTCFAKLQNSDFAVMGMDSTALTNTKPSKEFPLHLMMYRHKPELEAIIHTHSFFSVLWSCVQNGNTADSIPAYTPYLKMKVGKVGIVPYFTPGSQELFDAAEKIIDDSDAFILSHHGPVVGGKSIMDAFYNLEELEESAKIAYCLKDKCIDEI